MRKSLCVILVVLATIFVGSCKWTTQREHQYSYQTSAQVANAIKQKLLANLGKFADQNFAALLKKDLNEPNDSNRQLKQISDVSANQLFGILGLADPKCDTNGDGIIKNDELKCLNYAWKAYLPH